MPITGGSAMGFETKKQRNNYFRSVNTIINDGPAARPEWAKVPITFTEEDFRLKSAIHNDAMVIEVNIARWVIGKVLVDNGSSADILFLKTFEKMNLSQHILDPPRVPAARVRRKAHQAGWKNFAPGFLRRSREYQNGESHFRCS
jgi:hypothetical protein